MLERVRARGRPRGDAEARVDVLQVPGDRVLAQRQLGRDLPVRPAASRRAGAPRAAAPSGRAAARRRRPRRGRARSGAAPSSVKDRRAASSSSEAPSSSPSARQATGDEDAGRARRRTGRRAPSRSCRRDGGRRAPPARRRPRARRRRASVRRGRRASRSGTAPRSTRARGTPRAPRPPRRRRARPRRARAAASPVAADPTSRRARGGARFSAASPRPCASAEQGEPRLRLPAEPARLAVRGLRLAQLAAEAVELAAPVGRLRRRTPVEAVGEPRGGAPRLRERVVPRALELEDLRAVDETPARERDEVGLLAAPAREHPGPLPRAAHLEHVLAREDDGAVDHPGRDRREARPGDDHHRLVRSLKPSTTAPWMTRNCPCWCVARA